MITVEQLQGGVVIPIDKPRQWTSFQTVNKVKAVIRNHFGLKKFKIGHAGTLDPLATGLLLVCVGRATKKIEQLQAGEKVYTGTMVLGATTPCFDQEQPIDHFYPFDHINPTLLEEVRQQFVGQLEQVPPMFSAVKIEGRRAYEYARADDPSAQPVAKTVQIHEFRIIDYRKRDTGTSINNIQQSKNDQVVINNLHKYNNPVEDIPDQLPQLDFYIRCGKGTYIRSIARDLGLALQSGAYISALRREQVGDYRIEDAVPLEHVERFLTQ